MKESTKKILLSKKRGKCEIIALILYVVGVSIISFFHEPWFDEIQAWQIARSASLKEILFEIPHYEGHPQLWHLILAPFAKLGAPVELTLSAVNIFFCSIAVALLLFKSPFPKIVRCLIPFTFFFFYQYGVLSRPYCLMLLAFILLAITYKNRNTKPLPYILSLALLCFTQAFGLIIAGALCLIWVGEIFVSHKKNNSLKTIFNDKRTWLLVCIAGLAIFLILSIIPASDVYFKNMGNSFKNKLFNLQNVLIFPIDALFGICKDVESIKMTAIGDIFSCIGGAIILVIMFIITKANKKTLTFFLPYLMYCVFGSFVYLSNHHIGITTLLYLFIFWIMFDNDDGFVVPKIFITFKSKVESKLIINLGKTALILISVVPLSWTAFCCVNEIRFSYGPGEIATYIKENNLEGSKIMLPWIFYYEGYNNQVILGTSPSTEVDYDKRVDYTDVNGLGSTLSAYFDKNIFFNFNATKPEKTYLFYRTSTDEENERNFELWREAGLPDYYIAPIDLTYVYGLEDYEDYYEEVSTFEINFFWKFSRDTSHLKLYKRIK